MKKTEIKLNNAEHKKFCREMHIKLLERKWTVLDLAKALDVAPKSIYNFECDTTKNPSRYLAAKIFNELEMDESKFKKKSSFFLWFLLAFSMLTWKQEVYAYSYDTEIPLTCLEQQKIQMICDDYDVSYELVLAIAERESNYTKDAENGHCKGMFQLDDRWHECEDFFSPVKSAESCIRYLRLLFDKYEDDDLVLMSYHGEKDAIQKNKEGRMSSYARGILERSTELEREHGK